MKTSQNKILHHNHFKDAVETIEKDVIVVANAGAGKTRLLVEHYFFLLSQGYDPSNILTFTFTEKAATELRERIFSGLIPHPFFKELGKEAIKELKTKIVNSPIGTIHQFCLHILREGKNTRGGKRFKIIDEATEVQLREKTLSKLIQKFLEEENSNAELLLRSYGIGKLRDLIRSYILLGGKSAEFKGHELPSLELEEKALLESLEKLALPIQKAIERKKDYQGWLSFDDLEKMAIQLLERPNSRLKKYLSYFNHILVDEFQDTSPNQINLIEGIRKSFPSQEKASRLFCVGDPKQSIYRFRNVDRNLIKKTEETILKEGGQLFNFTDNYRSSPKVLQLVNQFALTAFPESLSSMAIHSENMTSKVELAFLGEAEEKQGAEAFRSKEAVWVVQEIIKLIQKKVPLERIAILFRASASSLAIIQQFKKHGIPYTIRGGQELSQRQEVQDLKHFLYFLSDPEDKISLFGLLRSPIFLISDATLYFLSETGPKEGFFNYLLRGDYQKSLKKEYPKEIKKLNWAVSVLNAFLLKAQNSNSYSLLMEFIDTLDLENLLAQIHKDLEANLAVEQWLEWICQLEEENSSVNLRQMVVLLKQLDKTPVKKTPLGDIIGKKGCVQLLTIHASKGLEFDTVFLIDLSRRPRINDEFLQNIGKVYGLKLLENRMISRETPLFQTIKDFHKKEDLEENKRLLYVAMTRAEKHLRISINPSSKSSNTLQALLLKSLGKKADLFSTRPSFEKSDLKSSPTLDRPLAQKPFLEGKTLPLPKASYTVSELETFSVCPLKHHYDYVIQISDQKWENLQQTTATEMGTYLHTALNFLHTNSSLTPEEAVQQIVLNQSLWLKEETVSQLVQCLDSYLESPLYEKIKSATEDYSELPFTLSFKSGRVRGQIDRLIRTPDGWTLIDFKYTSRKAAEEDLLKAYGFQMRTYTLAAKQLLKNTLPSAEIHLLGTQKAYSFSFPEKTLKDHQTQMETLMQDLGSPSLEKIDFRDECYRCPFNNPVPVCPIPKR